MEIASGDNVAFSVALHEDQRIIHRRIHLDLKRPPAEVQRIAHRSVDLGNAAQRIRVLHAPAVFVRFTNLASREQSAQLAATVTCPACGRAAWIRSSKATSVP